LLGWFFTAFSVYSQAVAIVEVTFSPAGAVAAGEAVQQFEGGFIER
jgi:hypothetical protein